MKKRMKSLWFEVKYESLDILWNALLISQRLFTSINASIAVPLYTSLCGSSVNILLTSSDWLAIFKINFHTLIKGSIEIFFTTTLKVCNICMRNSRWLVNTFYKFSNMILIETYIVDSLWWINSIDVGMKLTIWIFLKYFLVYNSSLKMSFSKHAMNMKIRVNKFCKMTL